MSEREIIGPDGTVRKAHYGTGRQPWDDIKDVGWGAPFCAGNVLKYVRRAAAKNGADDIAKAQWYYAELLKLHNAGRALDVFYALGLLLTAAELCLLCGALPPDDSKGSQ